MVILYLLDDHISVLENLFVFFHFYRGIDINSLHPRGRPPWV